jgi:hypothetical protein
MTAPEADEPPFWDDVLDRIPVCFDLVEHFLIIRDEVLEYIAADKPLQDYPRYAYFDPDAGIMRPSLYEQSWKAFPFTRFEHEHVELDRPGNGFDLDALIAKSQERLPATYGVVRSWEQTWCLANGFVSMLSPGAVIHPHRGWSDHFLRVHLCLIDDPGCLITVGRETRCWRAGHLLAFKDGGPFPHSVRHEGTRDRLILSVDLRLSALTGFCPHINHSPQAIP